MLFALLSPIVKGFQPRSGFLIALLSFALVAAAPPPRTQLRAPAYPIITTSPYMNVWLMGDQFTADWVRYWPGTVKAIFGMVSIDGQVYRWMGPAQSAIPSGPPVMIQQALPQFTATKTSVAFRDPSSRIQLEVEFLNPAQASKMTLEQLSRPVTYIRFKATSVDGKYHQVNVYLDFTGEWAVNDVSEPVLWGENLHNNVQSLYIGTSTQAICEKSGDAVGINWGFLHLATPASSMVTTTMNSADLTRSTWVSSGGQTLPPSDRQNMPRPASQNWPVIAMTWNFGNVGPSPITNAAIVAYDDQFSIKYFGQLLRPLWRHRSEGASTDWRVLDLLATAASETALAFKTSEIYDEIIYRQLKSAASNSPAAAQQYAELATLAYRQTLAGIQIVWNEELETPWVFMKEISSDGDLSTVDVIFPAAPFFLALNPELLKLMILPLMHYANNDTFVTYNRSYAPHHLGFYPVGFILTQEQENMPIEETGNMILMITALDDGIGNYSWIWPKYETLLRRWSAYLIKHLPDPGDQLCTDDFEGPSPHNVNLAAKGIVALRAFAKFYDAVGDAAAAQECASYANKYANAWLSMANDTTHFRLQYNLPNTTSLKYNIFWQYLLQFEDGPFSSAALQMELKYYMTLMKQYGIPLDNRATFTKLDWQHWIATMAAAEGLDSITTSIIAATWRWANETPTRVPLTDWYWTDSGKQQGFQARPVVGALYSLLALKQPKSL